MTRQQYADEHGEEHPLPDPDDTSADGFCRDCGAPMAGGVCEACYAAAMATDTTSTEHERTRP